MSIIWTGATAAGDTYVLKEAQRGNHIWEGRATGVNTYLGVVFPGKGLYVRNGVEVDAISSGRVYIYFMEE